MSFRTWREGGSSQIPEIVAPMVLRGGLRAVVTVAMVFTVAVTCGGIGAPVARATTSARDIPSAEDRAAGLWYLDALGIADVQNQGLRGQGIKIAVVDSGINLQAAELQGANITVVGGTCLNQDTNQPFPADSTDPELSAHGTAVVAMLVGNGRAQDGGQGTVGIVPDAEIEFFAAGPPVTSEQEDRGWQSACVTGKDEKGEYDGDAWEDAALAASRSGASIISISLGGSALTFRAALTQAAARGSIVVGAIPNPTKPGESRGGAYPGAGNGTVAVNGVDADGQVLGKSANSAGFRQWGSDNAAITAPGVSLLSVGDDWNPARGDGTSLATPLVAGSLALAKEKFPQATNDQLVQAAMRTTGGQVHGELPAWNEEYGYGALSVPGLLTIDPTTLPDSNPLFAQTPSDPRCISDDRSEPPESMSDCVWASEPTAAQVRKAQDKIRRNSSETNPPSSGSAADTSGEHKQQAVMWGAGALGSLLILGSAIAIGVRSRRSSRRRSRSHLEPSNDTREESL